VCKFGGNKKVLIFFLADVCGRRKEEDIVHVNICLNASTDTDIRLRSMYACRRDGYRRTQIQDTVHETCTIHICRHLFT
jgi:hypothetical protein